jgi:hypothetical protein
MNKIKKIVCGIFLTQILLLTPSIASAAALDIPCKPSATPAAAPASGTTAANTDLFTCINQLYKYALIISSIAATFMIILAGYLYIFSGGNDKRVSTAKSFISTSLLGIAVLLTGFLLLKQINPNLLSIKNITPQQIAYEDWDEIDEASAVVPSGLPPVTGFTVPTGSAQDLAKQILQSSNIRLGSDPKGDLRSGARQNILDTSNGQPAYTSLRGEARGKQVALDARMLAGLLAASQASPILVNFISGGDHSPTSTHYAGKGFDIQASAGDPARNKALMDACRAAGAREIIGPCNSYASKNCAQTGYATASDHNTHVHCGW